MYCFWVDRVRCPRCDAERDAPSTFQLAHDREKGRQTVVCPHCHGVTELPLGAKQLRCGCGRRTDLAAVPMEKGKFRCPVCDLKTPLHELCRTGAARPRLFAQEYLDADGIAGSP